jgi:lipopolysaccharide biosynthesis protein
MTVSVLKAVMPLVTIEGSTTKLPVGDRIAVVASYGSGPTVSRSLHRLVTELARCRYRVVVVRASDDTRELVWPGPLPADTIVIRKPNIGYDFGSWATALQMFPKIRKRGNVIFTNDSLVGPFGSLAKVLEHFEHAVTDVWGATNTLQIFPHLQSFFVGFRRGVLSDPALKQFWKHIGIEKQKQHIIDKYELGLSRLLLAEGFTTSACFESERIVDGTQNPTVEGWRRLLELGFPFVKRELLVNPTLVRDGNDVPHTIQEMYGTDPRDWL